MHQLDEILGPSRQAALGRLLPCFEACLPSVGHCQGHAVALFVLAALRSDPDPRAEGLLATLGCGEDLPVQGVSAVGRSLAAHLRTGAP